MGRGGVGVVTGHMGGGPVGSNIFTSMQGRRWGPQGPGVVDGPVLVYFTCVVSSMNSYTDFSFSTFGIRRLAGLADHLPHLASCVMCHESVRYVASVVMTLCVEWGMNQAIS